MGVSDFSSVPRRRGAAHLDLTCSPAVRSQGAQPWSPRGVGHLQSPFSLFSFSPSPSFPSIIQMKVFSVVVVLFLSLCPLSSPLFFSEFITLRENPRKNLLGRKRRGLALAVLAERSRTSRSFALLKVLIFSQSEMKCNILPNQC